MKISVTPFFKTIRLFCQPLSFYGKNLNSPFRQNFEEKPLFYKRVGGSNYDEPFHI